MIDNSYKKSIEQIKLYQYNFKKVGTVEEGFEYLKNEKLEYKLVYVIICADLSEEFMKKYYDKIKCLKIITANIILTQKGRKDEYLEKYEQSTVSINDKKIKYVDNRFLNPGGVVDSIDDVIKYIDKEEYPFKENSLREQNLEKYKGLKEQRDSPNYIFQSFYSLAEISLPIMFSKMIDEKKMDEEEFNREIELFFDLGLGLNRLNTKDNLPELIKPSKEKNINIPKSFLSKFWTRLYSAESDFYKILNKYLINKESLDSSNYFRIFIYVLYLGLNQKILKPYRGTLYRGTKILKKEYEKIKNELNEKKKGDFPVHTIYAKSFWSFSIDEDEAKKFIVNESNTEDFYAALFIIDDDLEGTKNEVSSFLVSNIDICQYIFNKEEKEILILPLSCLEITRVDDSRKNEKKKYKIIHLRYLHQYQKKVEAYFATKRTKGEINNFKKIMKNSIHYADYTKFFNKKEEEIDNDFGFCINDIIENKSYLYMLSEEDMYDIIAYYDISDGKEKEKEKEKENEELMVEEIEEENGLELKFYNTIGNYKYFELYVDGREIKEEEIKKNEDEKHPIFTMKKGQHMLGIKIKNKEKETIEKMGVISLPTNYQIKIKLSKYAKNYYEGYYL